MTLSRLTNIRRHLGRDRGQPGARGICRGRVQRGCRSAARGPSCAGKVGEGDKATAEENFVAGSEEAEAHHHLWSFSSLLGFYYSHFLCGVF